MVGCIDPESLGQVRRRSTVVRESPRVALWQHRQCAWCLRLKHRDGTPHWHVFPRLDTYSHGICSACRARL